MTTEPAMPHSDYTCNDYRQEMILLSLIRRVENADLPESERQLLRHQIEKLEAALKMS
jgi:hypothetical protein